MNTKSILIILASLFFIIYCDRIASKNETIVQPIDSLFKDYYSFKKKINPLEATKAGFSEYNDQLVNYISTPYQQELITSYTQFLKKLKMYDSVVLTPARRLSKEVMTWDCNIKREGLTNKMVVVASPMFDMPTFELTPIMQIQSLQLYFSQLAGGTSIQPFKTVADYDRWLKRVDAYLLFLDTCMVKMKKGIAQGVVLPKVLIRKMIPQLDGFIQTPVEQHLFYAPIGLMPMEFSANERSRLSEAYAQMITAKLIPKYKALQDFLISTYLPAGRETAGISALPYGRETFDYLIRYHTTTNMTAAEIHALGKREVARIAGEMEKVKTQIGFKGDLKAFFEHLRTSKEQMPYTQPQQVLDHFTAIKEKMSKRLNDVFDVKPKAGFKVQRTEAFREAAASAEYLPGSKDGSRDGVFYVPIPDVKTYNKFNDEALFLHEAIPGHHYQLSLQQENTNLPEFLHPESMSVFVEGWALYAESLGKELGLYEDPYQYFGMLSMEMHRPFDWY